MDIDTTVETRRARLALWVAKNGIPQKEKSLFSQLKGTSPFGEKVARRLELKYKMGVGYLDTPVDGKFVTPSPVSSDAVNRRQSMAPYYAWLSEEEMHLVTLYRTTSDLGRAEILEEAEASDRVIQSPSLVRNES